MSDCPQCARAAHRPHAGDYQARCLDCCARLVRSARPDRRMASALLAAVARMPGAPDRAEVIAHLAQTRAGGRP